MTLSKHRPTRAYDEQWIVDANDVHGLKKDLESDVCKYGEEGLVDTLYLEGAQDAIEILFGENGVDSRFDFMRELRRKMDERRIG